MQMREFPNIGEKLFTETLENGLQIYVMPKPGFSKSYAMFATNYGGADRRFDSGSGWIDTPAGVAHFLEHKMFDMPDGDNALSILAANGAQPNAFTSSAMTAYYFESTSGFDENLRTLLRFVSTPYFTPESVEKEQGIIGQEIGMIEDSPDFVLYMNALKCLYAHNPICESVAGSVESIARITDKTLYDCHLAFYNPANMALCVVGDVDPQSIADIAREILSKEPGRAPQRDYGPGDGLSPVKKSEKVFMEVSAPQFLTAVKLPLAEKGAPRQRQQLVCILAMRCLIGRSSRFYNRLYSEGLLGHDFGFELDCAGGTATLLAGGESIDPEKVLAALRAEIAETVQSGLDAGLFERVRKAFYGRSLLSLDSFDGLCQELVEGCFGGYCALDCFDMISSITKAEADAFIAENLTEDRLILSVVAPKAR